MRLVMKPTFFVAKAFGLNMLMIGLSAAVAFSIGHYFAAPRWAVFLIGFVLGSAGSRVTIAWMKRRIERQIAAAEILAAAIRAERKKRGLP
jgi:hypothetical protein